MALPDPPRPYLVSCNQGKMLKTSNKDPLIPKLGFNRLNYYLELGMMLLSGKCKTSHLLLQLLLPPSNAQIVSIKVDKKPECDCKVRTITFVDERTTTTTTTTTHATTSAAASSGDEGRRPNEKRKSSAVALMHPSQLQNRFCKNYKILVTPQTTNFRVSD